MRARIVIWFIRAWYYIVERFIFLLNRKSMIAKAESLQCKRGETRKFYHGTYENVWAEVQREGILWGVPSAWENAEEVEGEGVVGMKRLDIDKGNEDYRYTYLSPEKEYAEDYGDVLLEVEYRPRGDRGKNDNYAFDVPKGKFCWQFSVFHPIPLTRVRRIK